MKQGSAPAHSRLQRLRNVLLIFPVVLMGSIAYLLLRVSPERAAEQQASAIALGLFLAVLLTCVLGGSYIFMREEGYGELSWQALVAGTNLGGLLWAIFYMVRADGVDSLAMRAVIGASEGMLNGLGLTLVVAFVDARSMRRTPAGALRFVVVFLIVVAAFTLIQLIDRSGDFGDAMSGLLGLVMVLVMKAGLKRWDARAG